MCILQLPWIKTVLLNLTSLWFTPFAHKFKIVLIETSNEYSINKNGLMQTYVAGTTRIIILVWLCIKGLNQAFLSALDEMSKYRDIYSVSRYSKKISRYHLEAISPSPTSVLLERMRAHVETVGIDENHNKMWYWIWNRTL